MKIFVSHESGRNYSWYVEIKLNGVLPGSVVVGLAVVVVGAAVVVDFGGVVVGAPDNEKRSTIE